MKLISETYLLLRGYRIVKYVKKQKYYNGILIVVLFVICEQIKN